MKIVYIPDYLYPALSASSVGVKELQNIEFLVSILSPEDVAFYLYLNIGKLELAMPEDLAISFTNIVVAKDNLFLAMENSDNPILRQVKYTLNNFYLNNDVPSLDLESKVLSCDLMDEDTIRFTHVFKDMGTSSSSEEVIARRLYDGVIQKLYAFYPFEELAQLPLMVGFLKTSKKLQEGLTSH